MPDSNGGKHWQLRFGYGITLFRLLESSDGVDRLAWSPNGRLLAVGYPTKKIDVWDVTADKVIKTILLDDAREYVHLNGLSWSADGDLLAACYQDEYVRIWSSETGEYFKTLARHVLPVNSVAWAPGSGKALLTAGSDRMLLLWDVKRGIVERSYGGHHAEINRVAWSYSGDRFASVGADGQILVWRVADARLLKRYTTDGPVNSVAWTRDDRGLVCAGADGRVGIWNLDADACEYAERGHSLSAGEAAVSRNFPLIASKSRREQKILIWRTDTLTPVAEIGEPLSHYYGPTPAFHPAELKLASLGHADTTVAIWQLDLNQVFQSGQNLSGGALSPAEEMFRRKEERGEYDVFLCYNTADRASVETIAKDLKEKGIRPFFDQWSLKAGERWQDALAKQISTVKVAAIFLGSSGKGQWQGFEEAGLLDASVTRNCRIIPVILPGSPVDEANVFLRRHQWVDFNKIADAPLQRLVAGILQGPLDPAT